MRAVSRSEPPRASSQPVDLESASCSGWRRQADASARGQLTSRVFRRPRAGPCGGGSTTLCVAGVYKRVVQIGRPN